MPQESTLVTRRMVRQFFERQGQGEAAEIVVTVIDLKALNPSDPTEVFSLDTLRYAIEHTADVGGLATLARLMPIIDQYDWTPTSVEDKLAIDKARALMEG